MVNSKTFRDNDYKMTKKFMKYISNNFYGERVLDICGGIGRNGGLLIQRFKKIDILDL